MNYDFTYELPGNFKKRVLQYLHQFGSIDMMHAFQRCNYEYEELDYAYYCGFKGDNWNKKAIVFTIEGASNDICLLQTEQDKFEDAIRHALKSNESGYLVKNIFYYSDNIIFSEDSIIPSANEKRLNEDIATANIVLHDLIRIGEKLCLNYLFNSSSSENSINDYFRDMLSMKGYKEIMDQTRHGRSVNGKDAAEVDLLLSKNGKEVAIFEGLNLDSVKKSYIDVHIEKTINNYNSLGTPTFITAYVTSKDYEAFWKRYLNYLQNYKFSFQIVREISELAYPNASARIATIILSRDGYPFPVYFIAFKIS